MSDNPYTGSSFDDFLQESGLHEECTATAIKRILDRQLAEKMKRQNLTKTETDNTQHSTFNSEKQEGSMF